MAVMAVEEGRSKCLGGGRTQADPKPPQIRVNRGACRLGDTKPSLTLARRSSLTLTHLRPLDQSPHLLRVHFWPLASAAEMGSHGGVAPDFKESADKDLAAPKGVHVGSCFQS